MEGTKEELSKYPLSRRESDLSTWHSKTVDYLLNRELTESAKETATNDNLIEQEINLNNQLDCNYNQLNNFNQLRNSNKNLNSNSMIIDNINKLSDDDNNNNNLLNSSSMNILKAHNLNYSLSNNFNNNLFFNPNTTTTTTDSKQQFYRQYSIERNSIDSFTFNPNSTKQSPQSTNIITTLNNNSNSLINLEEVIEDNGQRTNQKTKDKINLFESNKRTKSTQDLNPIYSIHNDTNSKQDNSCSCNSLNERKGYSINR